MGVDEHAQPPGYRERMMVHAVLLGDSVFDNRSYVAPAPDVIRQLREELGSGAEATLLAVDGHVTRDVQTRQLPTLPAAATHLIISVGGNDALGQSGILNAPARSVGEAVGMLADGREAFASAYVEMLETIAALRLPTAVCTIYDTNYPEPQRRLVVAALALFNDVITRAAFACGMSLIDLRLVCNERADFANPIEPSAHGGEKIARAIASFVAADPSVATRPTIWTH